MASKTSEIQNRLLHFVQGGYDIILPNFYYGSNECDVFRLTESGFVIEYEIKVSRSDFFADFKKKAKHENLKSPKENCPNRFFYVTPEDLIKKEEVPSYAGLIYCNKYHAVTVKNAKLLHREQFTDYKSICTTLSHKVLFNRIKLQEIRNTDYEKELKALEKENEKQHKKMIELSNELCMLKLKNKKITEAPLTL